MHTSARSVTTRLTTRLTARRAARDAPSYGEPMHGTIPREPGPEGARALLAEAFEPDTDRLAHSLGVGRRAERVGRVLGDPSLLVAAAYLHDIGYAGAARDTGLHQLDGARYLRRIGASDSLTSLVAHHTSATVEAGARGLGATLRREFPPPSDQDLLNLLTYCDMTTSARGDLVTVDERFERIYDRYPADHLVARSMRSAERHLRQVVADVERRIR